MLLADPIRRFGSPSTRLRAGIVLWAISWLPIAQLVCASYIERLAIWGVQILLGIAGLALAGSTFVASVKSIGWRRAPGAMWRALLHGDDAA